MQKMINTSIVFFLFMVVVALLYLLAPILTPFLIGALLAYLADPLVLHLRAWRCPHLLSVVLVFFFIFSLLILLLVLLIPLLEKQAATLMDMIPGMIAWGQETLMPWLSAHLDVDTSINIEALKQTFVTAMPKVGGFVGGMMKTMFHSGLTVLLWMTQLFLIPVVTFYLLRDWDQIKQACRRLLPQTIEPSVTQVVRECDEVLSAFFRGQLLVMLALMLVYAIGLSWIGLKVGVMVAVIAGLASIVPYLGFVIGVTLACMAAFIQWGTWEPVLGVFGVFIIGHCLESFILTPYLIGQRIGLHPVAVIFAVMAGGALFGFFGVLLALPVAAVIMVCLRFLFKHRFQYE